MFQFVDQQQPSSNRKNPQNKELNRAVNHLATMNVQEKQSATSSETKKTESASTTQNQIPAQKVREYGPFVIYDTKNKHSKLSESVLDSKKRFLSGNINPMSCVPQVTAMTGELLQNESGVEFFTTIKPDPDTADHLGVWSGLHPRDGLKLANNQATIEIRISKHIKTNR